MKRLLIILALCCGVAAANPVLTILNPDIAALPGDSASWQFRLYNDTADWLVIVQTQFSDPTPIGAYADPFSGYPFVFYEISPLETWESVFGTYTVDGSTPLGAHSLGYFSLLYEEFTGQPSEGGESVGQSWVDASNPERMIDPPDGLTFQGGITAETPIPEPATALFVAGCLAALALARRRVRV